MLDKKYNINVQTFFTAIGFLFLWTMTAAAQSSETIGGVSQNVAATYDSLSIALIGFAYLLGIGNIGLGAYKLKEASESPQVGYARGSWHIIAGTGLTALPSVILIGCDTFFSSSSCSTSFNVDYDLGGGGSHTLGDMVVRVAKDIVPNIGGILLVGSSIIGGTYFTIRGLSCLRDASQQGGNGNKASDGLFRIICGALSFELPSMFGYGLGTFFGSGSENVSFVSASASGVKDCLSSAGGVACAAENVAGNLVPVFIQASFTIMFVVGAWMLLSAIWKLAEAHQSGQSNVFGGLKEGGHGFLIKIVMAILLLNMAGLMTAISGTFGVTDGVINATGYNSGSSLLSYTQSTSSGLALGEYTRLIEACLVILAMFGVLAVWKGVRVWVAYADGGSREQGLGGGMTYIVAGSLLTNAKFAICIITMTIIGNGMGFC